MRVVHVAPTPFGGSGLLGGGERFPLELARAMAGEVDTELVTFGPEPGTVREPGGLRVRVLRSRFRRRGHPAEPFALDLPSAIRRADVVHTHHTRCLPSRMAALTIRAEGCARLVTTDHGLGGGGWAGLLPALFHRHLPVSRYAATTSGLAPHRYRVIYGGVDPQRYAPDPGARRSGILFVGRITPHKGLDRLIRALPPGCQLTVAGAGGHDAAWPERGYEDLVRRLAAGRDVRFLGAVPDADLPRLYAGARVVVLPSVQRTCYGRSVAISELLGLVVLEAMATGTPVVASRIGGVPELVRSGETGLLVEPGDVAELSAAVAELTADPVRAERLGRRGREVVLEGFTWRHCAARCLDAYAEVVSQRGPLLR